MNIDIAIAFQFLKEKICKLLEDRIALTLFIMTLSSGMSAMFFYLWQH
jgi:hypothetical protein